MYLLTYFFTYLFAIEIYQDGETRRELFNRVSVLCSSLWNLTDEMALGVSVNNSQTAAG